MPYMQGGDNKMSGLYCLLSLYLQK